jgi:uncharacterized phiE125 gp8 family phage protein
MLKLTFAPNIEPVSVAEAKAHLRIDTDVEDAHIARLIQSARVHLEALHGLALIDQTWLWTLHRWPSAPLRLPLNPVVALESARFQTAPGVFTTLDAAALTLDPDPTAPCLIPAPSLPAPGVPRDGIELTVTAGFGPAADDVPPPIRHALLLVVAHAFENREPSPASASASPDVVELLAPWKRVLL